ncbi:hypothetical protein [Eubacterium sp. AF15-50]|uniref:hypothetical protein n=1 Tax=Eubacterium sp. AF15-50 TaxID=2293103 RepID=UPI002672049F|nr:hypothetical protein [Eubacterium sp. AF15-50]
MEENNINNVNDSIEDNAKTDKKKISPAKLIVPIIIVVILAVFAGVVYWAKVIKPKSDINKEVGYNTEEYIKLGQVKGIEDEISQEEWDENLADETNEYDVVDRAAKETDQVDVDIVAYIDNKKVDDLSMKEASFYIGKNDDAADKKVYDKLIGTKAGQKLSLEVSGDEAKELAGSVEDYSGKKVKLEIKVRDVSELVVNKVTDKWVKENLEDLYGVTTAKELYEWEKQYIIESNLKERLWKKVVDNATMSGYPADLYNDIVAELDRHIEAEAKDEGISVKEYKKQYQYTDEKLDEEYTYNVKSELVMWQLVKDLGFEASDDEIEEMYENEYEEVNLDSVEEMKKLYTKDEMKEAVLLDKAQQYVFDNAKISYNYKIK